MSATLNIAGLLVNLVGVVVLFLFGMPFQIRTEGKIPFSYMVPSSEKTIQKENLYGALSWLGLAMIIIGTGLQIAAAILVSR